jgi:hypothetical protein
MSLPGLISFPYGIYPHMNFEELQSLEDWFYAYCDSFSMTEAEDQLNIALKQVHTQEVCLNAVRIAQDLKMDPQSSALAEAPALFHDVGRFPQYKQYKTFDDSISTNHAALGTRVLRENKTLEKLAKQDQKIIVRSVALHNVFSLPANLDDETRLFAELVRDADKLDILRVFIEYFEQDEKSRAGAVALGLSNTPGYSHDIMSCLKKGKMALKAMLRNQNDFKLLQLTWIYDLNFVSSFRMLVERNLIARLSEKLPGTDEVAQAVGLVCGYVDKKLQGR